MELLSQELFKWQAPSDEKQFLTDKFARSPTIQKPIVDLLKETLEQLSRTTGKADLLVEQNLQPPVMFIKEQLS